MSAQLFVAFAAVLLASAACTASAGECFAIHSGYKSSIPLGAYSIYGGCIKGTVQGSNCVSPGQDGGSGNFATRAACCSALEPKVQGPNPQTAEPRPENINIKDLCLKSRQISDKELAAAKAAAATPKSFVMFKGQDLPAAADLPDLSYDGANKYIKICRGLDGTAAACKAYAKCVGFTYGGEDECGYLKGMYIDGKGSLLLKPNAKWTTYLLAGSVSKASGGALDCAKAPANAACKVKLPSAAGAKTL